MTSTETELKKEELETSKRGKGYELLKTDVLLIISPFLILLGWLIVNLNPVSAYTLDKAGYIPGMTGYPYSPIGLGILMSSTITLCVGIACHWVKRVSRGEFIILQAVGWLVLIFALYSLANSIRIVWVPTSPHSWQSFISIDPSSCFFIILLWFIGVLAITYGLAPLRKWFSESIS